MTKQRLLAIAVTLLLVLNGITVAMLLKGHHPPDGPPPGDRPKVMVIERLGLDEGQVERYEALIAQHRVAIGEKDAAIRAARTALFTDLREVDASHRDSLVTVITDLQAAVERLHYDHFAEVRALCRPDQRPRFDALIGELSGFFGAQRPRGPRP
jgi:hypothetical protein